MKIKINDKEIELKFGVRFVRELDKLKGVSQNGIKFGMGLNRTVPTLLTYDPSALADVLYCASYKADKRPTMAQIEDFIDDDENIETTFKDVLEALQQSNATKTLVKNLQA